MSARRVDRSFVLAFAGLLGSACEASDREIDEHERGDLILSTSYVSLHRLDRRVETVVEDPRYWTPPSCGHLTARAEDEIDRVLASLDPARDYEIDLQACRDRWSDGLGVVVNIEGFAHTPFHCSSSLQDCCTDELAPLGALYERVMVHLEGGGDELDAILESIGVETYPMLEPDEPCR